LQEFELQLQPKKDQSYGQDTRLVLK
jgi:hypothetical protein